MKEILKKRFMDVIKRYLVACVTGNIRDRNYYLGWLQGVTSATFWIDDIELYEYFNSEIERAIELSVVLINEAYDKF
jgi:hypothetical protein|nr:MAG TPA: hypothetical protein [Caudoviricetes sp.]